MEIDRFQEQIAEICREFDVSTLGVFGSFARGDFGPKSDVDLLVKFRKPVGLVKLIRIEDRFESVFGRPVDLGTEKSLHPVIKPSVLEGLKLIYDERRLMLVDR